MMLEGESSDDRPYIKVPVPVVAFEGSMIMGRFYGLRSHEEAEAAVWLLNTIPAGNA